MCLPVPQISTHHQRILFLICNFCGRKIGLKTTLVSRQLKNCLLIFAYIVLLFAVQFFPFCLVFDLSYSVHFRTFSLPYFAYLFCLTFWRVYLCPFVNRVLVVNFTLPVCPLSLSKPDYYPTLGFLRVNVHLCPSPLLPQEICFCFV